MNEPTTKIRVVALDDAKWDRDGILADLRDMPDIEVIAVTGDASRFMSLIKDEHPDVAIIDLRIGGDYEAGLKILTEVRAQSESVRCFVLTGYPTMVAFVEALDRKADAFISKEARHDGKYLLPDVVRSIMRGGRVFDGDLILDMRGELPLSHNPATGPDIRRNVELTDREKAVLILVGRHRTNAEIGADLNISENTVKTHIGNILQKLDAVDRDHAYRIAARNHLLE